MIQDFKVRVNPKQSEELQLKAFEMGMSWQFINDRKVSATNSPFLFFRKMEISHMPRDRERHFLDHLYKELTFAEAMAELDKLPDVLHGIDAIERQKKMTEWLEVIREAVEFISRGNNSIIPESNKGIKPGDIVRLKSDGRLLTAGEGESVITCYYWFNGQMEHANVNRNALEKVR